MPVARPSGRLQVGGLVGLIFPQQRKAGAGWHSLTCSATFLKHPQLTCLEKTLPRVNWALLYHLAIRKIAHGHNDLGSSSVEVPLFWVYFKLTYEVMTTKLYNNFFKNQRSSGVLSLLRLQ